MEDKKLDELTELLRAATINAEDMVKSWYGEYTSPELLATIEKANAILKELDHNKALTKKLEKDRNEVKRVSEK